MNRIVRLATIMIFFIFASGCEGVLFPLPYRSLAPFEGKVVNADTKKPLEGAAVLAVYYYTTYTLAGENSQIRPSGTAKNRPPKKFSSYPQKN